MERGSGRKGRRGGGGVFGCGETLVRWEVRGIGWLGLGAGEGWIGLRSREEIRLEEGWRSGRRAGIARIEGFFLGIRNEMPLLQTQ